MKILILLAIFIVFNLVFSVFSRKASSVRRNYKKTYSGTKFEKLELYNFSNGFGTIGFSNGVFDYWLKNGKHDVTPQHDDKVEHFLDRLIEMQIKNKILLKLHANQKKPEFCKNPNSMEQVKAAILKVFKVGLKDKTTSDSIASKIIDELKATNSNVNSDDIRKVAAPVAKRFIKLAPLLVDAFSSDLVSKAFQVLKDWKEMIKRTFGEKSNAEVLLYDRFENSLRGFQTNNSDAWNNLLMKCICKNQKLSKLSLYFSWLSEKPTIEERSNGAGRILGLFVFIDAFAGDKSVDRRP